MPVFNYLTEDGAADVYEYLAQYPPEESGTFDQVAQTTIAGTSDHPADSTSALRAEAAAEPQAALSRPPVSGGNYEYFFLPAGVGFFAVLLTSMCWITLHEFRRLSTDDESSRDPRRNLQRQETYLATWFRVRSAADLVADASGPTVETGEQRLTEWVDRRKIS